MELKIDPSITQSIIACYPAFAGGKFLINCLGLSDNCVLQDRRLAQKQLDGKFWLDDKICYIRSKMDVAKQNLKRTDLDLGSGQLFGHTHETGNFNITIDRVVNKNWYFCHGVHGLGQLKQRLKIWPNSKIIIFKNYKKFIEERVPGHVINTNKFDEEINLLTSDNMVYEWDTEWYQDIDAFLEKFVDCALWSGVNPVDLDYISMYYNMWTDTIKFIRDNK
jgi:hypothetical protein